VLLDFRRNRDRLIVAVALSIALHEIFLSIARLPAAPRPTETEAPATRIAIEQPVRTAPPKPSPTPKPTPPPTPPPHVTPPPRVTLAPVPQVAAKAKGLPAKRHGGGAHHHVVTKPKPTPAPAANPNAFGAGTGTQAGTGTGIAPGTGGGAGGNGAGTSGNGNAAVNANAPCGYVDFKPTGPPTYRDGTAYEPVEATVTFPDGHQESASFPYKWVYPNGEQTDPWSDTNLKKGNFSIAMQMPPAGTDPATYPSLIQYIMRHTGPDGLTDLPPCPKSGT
jgi:hypothetical protein